MFLVDSHCHLDMLDLSADGGNLDNVIQRAQQNAVQYFLNVCVSLRDFPTVLATAERYPYVAASVGLHPNEQDEQVDADTLIKLAQHNKVIAIGETGLDYFRTSGDVEWQRERFRAHIRAAKSLGLPLIIHTRDARADTLKIMREENAAEVGGVMHCFSEDWDVAQQALELGFYISFSGIVTFKSAVTLQDVAKRVPIDRLLVETDAPYLAPVPHRGKQNEPAYVKLTAEFIANLRGDTLSNIAEATTTNFFKLFTRAEKPNV